MTVDRSDLEHKLTEIQEAIEETTEGATNPGVIAAIAVTILVVLVYLIGRRKGRKAMTRVEVYRIR